jgi:hypothetical protein
MNSLADRRGPRESRRRPVPTRSRVCASCRPNMRYAGTIEVLPALLGLRTNRFAPSTPLVINATCEWLRTLSPRRLTGAAELGYSVLDLRAVVHDDAPLMELARPDDRGARWRNEAVHCS